MRIQTLDICSDVVKERYLFSVTGQCIIESASAEQSTYPKEFVHTVAVNIVKHDFYYPLSRLGSKKRFKVGWPVCYLSQYSFPIVRRI
jgi:hypothetical protein